MVPRKEKVMKKYLAAALMVVMLATTAAVFASENIWGRVDKIDTAQKTITAWNGQLGTFTMKVDSETKITQDGKTISLGEIKVSSHISGSADKQSDGTYLCKELNVTVNTRRQTCTGIGGRIESIDLANRTLSMWSANLGNYKVKVASDAKITKDDKEAKLEDLKTGNMAWFIATKNDDGTYTATSVESRENGGRGGCGGGGCRGGGGNGRGKGRGKGGN